MKILNNDAVSFAMKKATELFGFDKPNGYKDGVFNLSCLSAAICKITGLKGPIDGNLLAFVLIGRQDVEKLSGGCHYKFLG